MRTGGPWRDLPGRFGRWNSNFQRFRRWAKKKVLARAFEALSGDPDFEYAMVDGTIIRVHQHGTDAKRGARNQAIGRSRGGLPTKILALVDALGNLVRFVLLPGHRHDVTGFEDLIADIPCRMLLADKAFDVDWLRAELESKGIVAVIPPKANRKRVISCDFAT